MEVSKELTFFKKTLNYKIKGQRQEATKVLIKSLKHPALGGMLGRTNFALRNYVLASRDTLI